MRGTKREDKVPAKKAERAKIQAVTLSELCRIVSAAGISAPRMDSSDMPSQKGAEPGRGGRRPWKTGRTWNTVEEPFGVKETACIETIWEKNGQTLGRLVRYADDFVIVSRTMKDAEHALKLVKVVMQRLELTLHPEKTRIVPMWAGQGGFDFLGMHHKGFIMRTGKTQKYQTTYQFPSKKAMKKMRAVVKEELGRRSMLKLDVKELIERMNPKIRGWRNYYGLGTAKQWLRKIDWYLLQRFTIWYNKKKQKKGHYLRMRKVYQLLNKRGLLKLAE
jgi:hypothetical protein